MQLELVMFRLSRPNQPILVSPIVTFATGGLVDILCYYITCALAQPFNSFSLSVAICCVSENLQRRW